MVLERSDPAAVQYRPTPATARAVLARLFRWYLALCLVLVPLGLAVTRLAVTEPLRNADEAFSERLAGARSGGWNALTAVITGSTDTLWAIVTAAVLSAAIWLRWRSRLWTVLPLGLALELSVFLTVSYAVGRERPAVPKLGHEPSTFSFPSGHAAAATVIWLGLALVLHEQRATPWLRVPIGVVAVVLPAGVAVGRVYRGMHYTLDVVGGVAMGAAVVLFVVRMLRTLPMQAVEPEDAAPAQSGC
ncbi:MAG: phosphatase PAP2 family protein [Acidimicrobiia bacterium]